MVFVHTQTTATALGTNKVLVALSWFISDGMAGIRKELACPSCFVVGKDRLVMAVLPGAFESWDCCRAGGCKSRLALLLGLQPVGDSGTPKFPLREAELTSQTQTIPQQSPADPQPRPTCSCRCSSPSLGTGLVHTFPARCLIAQSHPRAGSPQEDVAQLEISLGPPKRAGKGFSPAPPMVRLLQKHRTCRILFYAGNHLHPYPTLLKMEAASFPRSSCSGIAQQEARREIQVPAVP